MQSVAFNILNGLFLIDGFLVLPQLHELVVHESADHHGERAAGHQEQQCGLRGLEVLHHREGGNNSDDLAHEAVVEVGRLEVVHVLRVLHAAVDVVFEAEGHEDARNHNVAEPQHRELRGVARQVVGEDELDGRLHRFCHCYHHVGAVDPEDVVEEEAPEQDEADLEVGERDLLDAHNRKGDSEEVVAQPAARGDLFLGGERENQQADRVEFGDVHVDGFLEHD